MSIKPPFARRRAMISNIAVNRPSTEAEVPIETEVPIEVEVQVLTEVEVQVEPPPIPLQARDVEGQFVPDDPATPDVNEAFVGGVPTKPAWSSTMNKKQLLSIASDKGVEGLSMADTKRVILAALDEASL